MKIQFLYLAGIVALASCSSISFTSDKDPDADFSQYKTLSYYGWADESSKVLNDLEKKRIEMAFADEFKKRGISIQETGGDIIVSLYIVVDQKTGVTAYNNHYGGGGPYGYHGYYGAGWGWGMGYGTTSYSQYDYYVGTLICDVFDSKTKKLVWQGVVSGEIDENPRNREQNIPRVVKEIMKRYPVVAGK
jgi:hypothetical protein